MFTCYDKDQKHTNMILMKESLNSRMHIIGILLYSMAKAKHVSRRNITETTGDNRTFNFI